MAISLTENAANRIRTYSAGRNQAALLRLGVKNVGCSGKAYVVEYADGVTPGDRVFESRGIKILVDADSLPFLDGTEVDYTREGLSEGFRFNNPNVKAQCGCGESFSIE